MIIPWQELDPDTLDNVIREYVLSKLEDYQMESTQMSEWINQVKSQLRSGEAVIEWSEANESVTIVESAKYSG
ncbi:YheU family protein [Pleionea litopenaei]|uniref:YheU family protein n=1 Tax=Pleionea litopenaei TaxID=3070815 RepID=A0AA51X6E1_9GAMM|nr:YheU family protein [Pleionea sp. HL-JVS1]WMS86726.1 YheU family protein [Pleionea sp. HL-JVS1]